MIGGIGTLYPNSVSSSGDLYVSDCANYGSIHVLYKKVVIEDKAENDVEALDRRTLTAGCIAAKGQWGVTTRTYFTRCISVTPNNELDAGTGLQIRFAPIMGYATRQSANEPDIQTIDNCYYYADDSKCRIYQPTHLNEGLVAPDSRAKEAFYRTQPWTATRLEPWLPLAASESDTWAGYTVPVLNVLSVEELFGGGTASNPFLIYTENDLANLSAALVTHPDAHFRLMNDLYMADKPAFTSIKEELDYLGTFDGNGHCIDGLRVTRHALFDKLSGTVKNLTLTNFRGNEMDNYNTSIAGYLDGTIENCAVYGTISSRLESGYETNAAIKASGIARTVYEGGVIRGCMFKGTLKASSTTSDGKSNTWGTPSCEVSGIAHSVSGTVENCYASFNLDIADGFKEDYLPKRGIGSTTGSGVIRNCAFVCAEASALGNSGITKCTSEADITPAMLGDTDEATWLQGAYRPVNKKNPYLTVTDPTVTDPTVTDPTVTDPTGQPTYLDLCPDDAWTPNKVYNLTLTANDADDAMLMRFRNLALYNQQTQTSYIIGLMLDREKTSFDYQPAAGCTATKGATTITLKKEDALDGAPGHFLLCLPCPLRTADLPEGSQLHGLGYLPDNESKANAWVFYLTECDSVGAGVPCHVYIPDCKTGDYTLLSYGDIVTEPQGTTEYGPQGYFTPTNISKAYTGITVESDNNTPVYLTYTEGSTAMKLFSAAAKSETRTDKQWLSTLRILDEEDPYLHQSLHELHGTTKDNLYVKRGLVGGQWNTLTLPFKIEASTLASYYGMNDNEFEVQELSSITTDGGGLVLNFTEATTLEAGKPYLVKPIRDCDGFDVANVYCPLTEVLTPVTVSDGQYKVTMQPNYAPIVLVAGDYFLSGGKIYVVSDDMTVASKGLRAHFTANAAASEVLESARLVFEGGDVTDINGISSPVQAPAGVYDLSGRRVKQPSRGLYIINGRKVIVH